MRCGREECSILKVCLLRYRPYLMFMMPPLAKCIQSCLAATTYFSVSCVTVKIPKIAPVVSFLSSFHSPSHRDEKQRQLLLHILLPLVKLNNNTTKVQGLFHQQQILTRTCCRALTANCGVAFLGALSLFAYFTYPQQYLVQFKQLGSSTRKTPRRTVTDRQQAPRT